MVSTVVIRALSKLKQEDYSRSEVGLGHSVRSSVLVTFFPSVTKYQTEPSLEKEAFIEAHSLRTQSRVVGTAPLQEEEAAGHPALASTGRKQTTAGARLTVHRMIPPIFMVGLPISINPSRNVLINMPKSLSPS